MGTSFWSIFPFTKQAFLGYPVFLTHSHFGWMEAGYVQRTLILGGRFGRFFGGSVLGDRFFVFFGDVALNVFGCLLPKKDVFGCGCFFFNI